MELKDKIILITGAGKGSGRKLAEQLAKRGAIIAANDISPMNVEEVVDGILANGGNAKAYVEDIAKKVGAQTVIKNVEDDFGGVDILINHAAVEPHGSLLAMDEWDWHRTLEVNLTGAFLMIQTAGRVMKTQGKGVILNLVADSGGGSGGEAGAYFTSKAGLMELSHQADRELSQHGIRIHAVSSFDAAMRILEEA